MSNLSRLSPSAPERPSGAALGGLAVRDVLAPIPSDFRLESGERLGADGVRARLHGVEGAPLVAVAGGISSGYAATEWWPGVVAEGGPLDPRRLRVLSFDFLPGLGEGAPPTLTTRDQARLLALVLDHLGESRLDAFVGASYGGCVGLAFAAAFPQRLGRLIVISAAHRAHPQATAWRGVQRRVLQLGLDTGRVDEAVALARELAMTTYRTPEEFDLRFGAAPAPAHAGGEYAVCGYLTARGRAYAGVTDPARWICLSDSLDRHAVTPETLAAPLSLLAFDSDRLVPVEDIRDLAARATRLERLVEAASVFGHDAFLKEGAAVARFLDTALSPLFAAPRREIAA